MNRLIREMDDALYRNDFDDFYEKNLAFHDIYIDLSTNSDLVPYGPYLQAEALRFSQEKGFP